MFASDSFFSSHMKMVSSLLVATVLIVVAGFVFLVLPRVSASASPDSMVAVDGLRSTVYSGTDFSTISSSYKFGEADFFQPLFGDFDGNGLDRPASFERASGTFLFANKRNPLSYSSTTFPRYKSGDVGLLGDWDGDGKDSVGVYRPSSQKFFLSNKLKPRRVKNVFSFKLGEPGDLPFVGDFNGDGFDTIGLYRPSSHVFYVLSSLPVDGSPVVSSFMFGSADAVPVVGDLNGDGVDELGVFSKKSSAVAFFNGPSFTVPSGTDFVVFAALGLPSSVSTTSTLPATTSTSTLPPVTTTTTLPATTSTSTTIPATTSTTTTLPATTTTSTLPPMTTTTTLPPVTTTSTLPPVTTTTSTTVPSSVLYAPRPGTTWHWQLEGSLDLNVDVQMVDIDLFETSPATVDALHARGVDVVCYMAAGSWENFRPDSDVFPDSVKGRNNGWPGEKWLDVRQLDVLGPIMEARLDLCASKGFDGVEFDLIDGFSNNTGFPLSAADQRAYNLFLAAAAHDRGLAAGFKNNVEQAASQEPFFDFAVNEECFQYDECEMLSPFIDANKAVFHVEYEVASSKFCPLVNSLGFSSMLKNLNLNAWTDNCWD